MFSHPTSTRYLMAATLLLAGCAQPSNAPSTPAAKAELTQRSVLSLPGAETVSIKATAPMGTFAVATLPKGNAIGIEFNRKGDEPGELNAVYFQDGIPFEVRVRAGAAFVILDNDATDGVASVQLPAGTFDAYVSTKGKPTGSVDVIDPIYFQAANLLSTTAKRDWFRIGLRQSALPATYRRGGYSLKFNPKGLTGFSTRWFASAATAPVPPVPPEVTDLQVPALVQPGQAAAFQSVARDLNGDVLGYRWSAAAGTLTGEGSAITWKAPRPAGRYAIGFSVEDAYFVTSFGAMTEVEVPNVPPVATALQSDDEGGFPAQVKAGRVLNLSSSATDENEDALTWSWSCSGGTVVGSGASATWTAPAEPGDYQIAASVTDGVHVVTVTRTVPVFLPAEEHPNNGVGQGSGGGVTDNRGNGPSDEDKTNPGYGDGVGGGQVTNPGRQKP